MGKLYAVSGNSGAGKTSVMRTLMGASREVVSVTTREKREGEINGVDYYFISQERFDELDLNGELAEKTTYYGRASYAVTTTQIESKLSSGNAYIIVDYNGMEQLKKIYPSMVSIFIFTSPKTAFERMKHRGDSVFQASSRLSTYHDEIMNMVNYDYAIRNARLEDTLNIISAIIDIK